MAQVLDQLITERGQAPEEIMLDRQRLASEGVDDAEEAWGQVRTIKRRRPVKG